MKTKSRMIYRLAWLPAAAWSVVVGRSLYWNADEARQEGLELARNTARASFLKDHQAFRLWAGEKGGVYIPPTAETPPSHYMAHIPERTVCVESMDGEGSTFWIESPLSEMAVPEQSPATQASPATAASQEKYSLL